MAIWTQKSPIFFKKHMYHKALYSWYVSMHQYIEKKWYDALVAKYKTRENPPSDDEKD